MVRFSPRVICKQPWASCYLTACSGQLSLLPSAGWEMSISFRLKAQCGWLGRWYVCCLQTVGSIVRWCRQRMAVVSLARANQLPLPRLQSVSGHESDSCKKRYSKYRTFTCMVSQHLARCMHVVCGCVLGWRSSCLEVWTGTTRFSTLTISSPAFPRTRSVSRPVIQRLNHDHHSGELLPHVNHCQLVEVVDYVICSRVV